MGNPTIVELIFQGVNEFYLLSFQCWAHSHETLASVRKSTSASKVALVWACAACSSAKSDNACLYSA